MKKLPVHQNLDTAFVNLPALIKYLRRREFVGSIRVELGTYEADIVLTADNEMKVREHDRLAGRIAEGDEVLQRLLIRAREPGGIINVFQTLPAETKPSPAAIELSPAERNIDSESAKTADEFELPPAETRPLFDAEIPRPNGNAPHFPFELSNRVESRAKQAEISAQEWLQLLDLTGELLAAIETSLFEAGLVFSSAFEKARFEISADYPFLSPISGIFTYKGGKVALEEQINAKVFVAGVNEALKRILDKLGKNPKFTNIYRATTQQILALIYRQKTLYDKYSITPQLEKTIGA